MTLSAKVKRVCVLTDTLFHRLTNVDITVYVGVSVPQQIKHSTAPSAVLFKCAALLCRCTDPDPSPQLK